MQQNTDQNQAGPVSLRDIWSALNNTVQAINALNAARACYGLQCPRIVVLEPPVKLISEYTRSGRAAGRDPIGNVTLRAKAWQVDQTQSYRLGKDIEMHCVQIAVAALVIGVGAPVALIGPTFAQTCACAPAPEEGPGGHAIQADEPPPQLPEYDQPPLPAPGYYWTPGYWAWNNYDYYWVPGAWVEPPQPGTQK